ncbi:hypothetical protein EV186_1031083 [Labedaea rhizosphaerae]|uniref:Uncharacterized protein n=1 Tax=Labedaea rhizosphaerae TaxID=598644 RepID=A0A4R6SEK6_LABRH|nr:hypothetical protein EV186_1031083 [Labedaea rhizosphaerae]
MTHAAFETNFRAEVAAPASRELAEEVATAGVTNCGPHRNADCLCQHLGIRRKFRERFVGAFHPAYGPRPALTKPRLLTVNSQPNTVCEYLATAMPFRYRLASGAYLIGKTRRCTFARIRLLLGV